jgi:hypothetical protein
MGNILIPLIEDESELLEYLESDSMMTIPFDRRMNL